MKTEKMFEPEYLEQLLAELNAEALLIAETEYGQL
jgi:hypothetical protein